MIKKISIAALAGMILLTSCGSPSQTSSKDCLKDSVAECTGIINSDILMVVKEKGGPVEKLEFKKAVTENAGTVKEAMCLSQCVAFRAAQLASQAWEDGVFRCYEVKTITTGWNTDGVYEFFSDKEFNGQPGDLQIASEKILIKGRDAKKATSTKRLTKSDMWYEITFVNGLSLTIDGSGREIITPLFMTCRRKKLEGDKTVIKKLMAEKKRCIKNIKKLPFNEFDVKAKAVKI